MMESIAHAVAEPWWQVAARNPFDLLSIRYWLTYLLSEYEREPGHVAMEIVCIATVVWLVLRKPYDPKQELKLTKKQEEELINEWTPVPLQPNPIKERKVHVVESVTGPHVTISNKSYVNFASTNFLDLAQRDEIKEACASTIEKYGVGSCGPRGFYGTFDVHLQVEQAISDFLGAEESILYSDGIACISSVIPAFAKKGDFIICDSGVHFGIQQGCKLSRSNVIHFKHNDMADLERVLKEVADSGQGKKLTRRFIVVEGIYQHYGDLCNLPAIVALKNKYKFRLILDDSLGFGVLGKHGKGIHEHYNISINEINFYCATLDASIASVGGFCAGQHQNIDHQRLSGAGYCFSASSPPYSSTASLVALSLIQQENELCNTLRQKASKLRKLLSKHSKVVILGEEVSPVLHARLHKPSNYERETALFQQVADALFKEGYVVHVPEYIPAERIQHPASIRIYVNVHHTEAELESFSKVFGKVTADVLRHV